MEGLTDHIELAEVRMKQPVPFDGPSSLTLVRKTAEELYMLPKIGLIVAKRHGKERVLIPLSATAFSREYRPPEAKPEPAPAPAPEPAPEPVVDVVKFEKDPKTGAIRELARKVAQAKAE